MSEYFVIVSEHDTYRPGRFQSSITYGPFTERGAERVARRALSQVSDPSEWQTYGQSGNRYARDEHGTRMVDVFDRPAGTYHSAQRNMPKD